MDQVKFVEDADFEIFEVMAGLGRPYHFKFVKGCLPRILVSPFFNTLSQL